MLHDKIWFSTGYIGVSLHYLDSSFIGIGYLELRVQPWVTCTFCFWTNKDHLNKNIENELQWHRSCFYLQKPDLHLNVFFLYFTCRNDCSSWWKVWAESCLLWYRYSYFLLVYKALKTEIIQDGMILIVLVNYCPHG